jgi:hypothetical protein
MDMKGKNQEEWLSIGQPLLLVLSFLQLGEGQLKGLPLSGDCFPKIILVII